MHRFRDLKIWRRSCKFCIAVYRLTRNFPSSERFGLTNQLRRASVSVPSNIAEGCSRSSSKELQRYLEIAIGSCYEMETQLNIAIGLGFVGQDEFAKNQKGLGEIIKMIVRFKHSIQAKSDNLKI